MEWNRSIPFHLVPEPNTPLGSTRKAPSKGDNRQVRSGDFENGYNSSAIGFVDFLTLDTSTSSPSTRLLCSLLGKQLLYQLYRN
jgi:hypothetical protein